jgi:hypothetical protein
LRARRKATDFQAARDSGEKSTSDPTITTFRLEQGNSSDEATDGTQHWRGGWPRGRVARRRGARLRSASAAGSSGAGSAGRRGGSGRTGGGRAASRAGGAAAGSGRAGDGGGEGGHAETAAELGGELDGGILVGLGALVEEAARDADDELIVAADAGRVGAAVADAVLEEGVDAFLRALRDAGELRDGTSGQGQRDESGGNLHF